MKAVWRNHDWSRSPHPEREHDYALYEELVHPLHGVIATVEAFAGYPSVHYANTANERSGPMTDHYEKQPGTLAHDRARQWCEAKTGNLVN